MSLCLLAAHDVPPSITGLFAAVLVGLVACLALEEKLHAKKSVIAGMFAIISLLLGAICGVLPFQPVVVGSQQVIDHSEVDLEIASPESAPQSLHLEADRDGTAESPGQHALHLDGHEVSMPVYIPGIDWGVIAIIVGSSLFVDITSKSGLFTWIAIRATKLSRGDPRRLLWMYGVMTVVFSAVLNNVTAMIIVGSLTCVSLDKLQRRSQLAGFLLIEGLLTNIGGLLTLISSVPNILVGTAAHIDFLSFFLKAGPYVAVTTGLTLWLGARMFRIEPLRDARERETAEALVAGFDENDGIESWGGFWFGAVMLALFIVTIASTSALPYLKDLKMGFVALAFAGVMLLRYKSDVEQFYRSVDWDLIGFFMALFVVIYVMEHAHVLQAIGAGLQTVVLQIEQRPAGARDSAVLLVGAAAFSSVTDNIPLAAMLASILSTLGAPLASAEGPESGLWWSVIFGANLGGNLTPIGSASTLVAVTIMHKHQVPMSFLGFVKQAAPFAALHIALALAYVLLFLR